MNQRHSPAMSVILVTPHTAETLRPVLSAWRRQTVADQLEILVVAHSLRGLGLTADDTAGFLRHEVVELGNAGPGTHFPSCSRAAGARRATAPLIALAEDHCFPEPDWAAAMIARHRGPWAAVGPVMLNANPSMATSWANLIIEYGPWMEPAAAGPVQHLPGHNSVYKREVLLAQGEPLEDCLKAESVFQWRLVTAGEQLYLEPAARSHHVNVSSLPSTARLRLNSGRLFAATRAKQEDWSPLRRWGYAAASPLIPMVRLYRIHRQRPRIDAPLGKPRIWLALLTALMLDGIGQCLGYVLGAGNAVCHMSNLESQRELHLAACDNYVFAGNA